MGIDPGTNFTGFGIISVFGKKLDVIDYGFIELSKKKDAYEKLKEIFIKVSNLIDYYDPHEVAFESPFYGENVQSMLKLGRAQGVAMAAALTKGRDVFEYAPRKIKLSITGQGAASKEQVASFLGKMFKITDLPSNLDSTDGLAVAVCHYYQSVTVIKSSGKNSWSDFIKNNPDRVKNG
ncbi:MAG: crossover junction endodeoxyribonuclease RuvC [Rikenellaceae bacterium]|nr:crossover junction endodeoxyribonuclease RuvC [Rikenellaceae bacterium]